MDIADLREKAEAGSVVAQTVLGICYLDEIDVEVDYKEAFRLLSAAADKGVPRAAANLARMYAEGLGIAASPITAIRFHEAAARAENSRRKSRLVAFICEASASELTPTQP
jgi:TPR repeat protein